MVSSLLLTFVLGVLAFGHVFISRLDSSWWGAEWWNQVIHLVLGSAFIISFAYTFALCRRFLEYGE